MKAGAEIKEKSDKTRKSRAKENAETAERARARYKAKSR